MSAFKTLSSGRGLQIVRPNPDHTFFLDEKLLTEFLSRPDIRNRSVILLAVAGAFRKGKSFLLNLFLRYLYHRYELNLDDDNWLGSEDERLRGFDWRGGTERHTTGLLIWSEPFKATLNNGEEVAIFLMDTQGTFDGNSTMRENATIFALSTMVSSILIYNLSQNIEESDLQFLQAFTDFGQMAMEQEEGRKKERGTPFQELMFLIRDWNAAYEYELGAEGGQRFLEKWLEEDETQHKELKTLRREIKSYFARVTCFLLPHPGMKVATSPGFEGKLSDVEPEFKEQIKNLIPSLLAPNKLEPKIMLSEKIKVKNLLHYFTAFMKMLNGPNLPAPQTIMEATGQANNLSAVADAHEVYEMHMEEVAGGGKPYLSPDRLAEEHTRALEKALFCFQSKKKMGGKEMEEHFEKVLLKILEGEYSRLRGQNESKSIFNIVGTAVVFVVLLVVGIIINMIGNAVSLEALELIGQFTCVVGLVSFGIWIYSRLTGQIREISAILDYMARKLRDTAIRIIVPGTFAVMTPENSKQD